MISRPGPSLLVVLPLALVLLVGALAAACFVKRTPWPSAVVLVVALLVVVGTRYDVSIRARFELHRDELTDLVTSEPPPSADEPNASPWIEVPGYGSAEVVSVPGGTMIVTGGHPEALGFVHLPDADDVEGWDGPAALRSLGGDWYLTV
jgi:hypothetical protein